MELTHSYCHTFKCKFCNAPASNERPLKHCSGCQLVFYCSDDCQEDDWCTHKYCCAEFPVVNGNNALHTTRPWKKHITSLFKRASRLRYCDEFAFPIFKNPKVCHYCRESQPKLLTICKCTSVFYCSEICSHSDVLHKKTCKNRNEMEKLFSLKDMRDSYPKSFWYAMCNVIEIGPDYKQTRDITSLNIHVITSTAYDDAESWECLFHHIPFLEQVNLVFIIQDHGYNTSFELCEKLTQLKCRSKNCTISYSVYQKPYHMFFSSPEYTEPDFVVAFGIPCLDDDIHSEISYSNMTYCEHTVIILMDTTKELVMQGIKALNAARPVREVESPQRNRNRGFGSNICELDFDAHVPNVKKYMAVLERNVFEDCKCKM